MSCRHLDQHCVLVGLMLYPVTGCNGEGVAALPTDLFTVDAARAASRHDRVNAVRTAAISPIGITGFKPLTPKSDRRHGVSRKCDSRTVQPPRKIGTAHV